MTPVVVEKKAGWGDPAGVCVCVMWPALSIIFPGRAGNGLLWRDPVLHWACDKVVTGAGFEPATSWL